MDKHYGHTLPLEAINTALEACQQSYDQFRGDEKYEREAFALERAIRELGAVQHYMIAEDVSPQSRPLVPATAGVTAGVPSPDPHYQEWLLTQLMYELRAFRYDVVHTIHGHDVDVTHQNISPPD